MRNIILPLFLLLGAGCSSSPAYKAQPLGERATSRVLEYDYPVVWKGIRDALAEFRIEEANEQDGHIQTDWAYSTSGQKFIEVQVNGFPRRKYLQTRYRYRITAKKQIIGVLVNVDMEEEVENLGGDGSFKGWDGADEPDSGRAHEMLRLIEQKIQGGRLI